MEQQIALLFSGGGAQYVGMGQDFYERYVEFRDVIDEASDILGYDLKKLCFDGDIERLSNMKHSQVAIFTVSIAMYRVLQTVHDLSVQAMAGHSLGEYSALTSAGVLTFQEGLFLVKKRGELLHHVGKGENGAMMAVNALAHEEGIFLVEELQKEGWSVFVSNVNSPKQFVLSGDVTGIKEAKIRLLHAGGKTQILPIPTCSHCSLMSNVQTEFSKALDTVSFRKMKVPVYANISGNAYKNEQEIKGALLKHLVQPVLWEHSIRSMLGEGIQVMIEVGPQSVLKSINHFIDESLPSLAFDNSSDRLLMDSYFQKNGLSTYENYIDRLVTLAVCQPNLTSNKKDVIEKISNLIHELEDLKEMVGNSTENMSEFFERSRTSFKETLEAKGLSTNAIDTVFSRI